MNALKTWPERIFLVLDSDDCELGDFSAYQDTPWSTDKINDLDVEYVRADLVETFKTKEGN